MYFSIAAPQSVTLPDGTVLQFRVNPQDSSLVEIHVLGEAGGEEGTHLLTFKRNGGAQDTSFTPAPRPATDDWKPPADASAPTQPVDSKPAT